MDNKHAKEEYEIQIYKFSIKQVQEDTESIIKKRTYDFITSLFRSFDKLNLINEKDPRFDEIRQRILHNIFIKIKSNVNAIHKKFAEYFAIPENVVLLENMPHEKYCKESYDLATRIDRVNKLEVELLQMKLYRKKLQAELAYHKEIDLFLIDKDAMIGIVKSILTEGNLISEGRNEEIMINKLKQINVSLKN